MTHLKKSLNILFALVTALLLTACEDEVKDILIPYPEDITFNELELGRFSFSIPSDPLRAGDDNAGYIVANVSKNADGSFGGFALSNKNYRSYPWTLSPDFAPETPLTVEQRQEAIDSTIFSVYTTRPNHTENFLVGHAVDDEAYITLEQPSVVEHVLVANTTYNYLLNAYGSVYSGTLNPTTQAYLITGTKVRNPNIPSTAVTDYGRWYLPGPDGKDHIRLAGSSILSGNPGYVKLIITGYNGNTPVGVVDFWLAVQPGADPENPAWNFIRSDWFKVDLTSLGTVDKLLFTIESSYNDASGQQLTPPYFALDGIRIRKN